MEQVATSAPQETIKSTEPVDRKLNDPLEEMEVDKDHEILYREFNIFVEEADSHQRDAMKIIWDYAKRETKSNDKFTIYDCVKKMRDMVGENVDGGRPWQRMLTYIKAYRELEFAQNRLDLIQQYGGN